VAGRSVASGHTTRRTIAGQIPVWWTCAAARGLDRGQLASAGPRWQPFQLLGLDCVVGDDHACARSRQIGPLPTAKRLLGPFPCSFSTRRLGPCGDKGNGLRLALPVSLVRRETNAVRSRYCSPSAPPRCDASVPWVGPERSTGRSRRFPPDYILIIIISCCGLWVLRLTGRGLWPSHLHFLLDCL
jgi:hypothetical protein